MASFCSGCGFPLAANVAVARIAARGRRRRLVPRGAFACASARAGAGSPGQVRFRPYGLAGHSWRTSVVGVAAVAGVWYVGHRVKEAVVEKAKAYGVELPIDLRGHTSAAPVRLPKTCDLLSKEDAATLLGEPIDAPSSSRKPVVLWPCRPERETRRPTGSRLYQEHADTGREWRSMQAALHQISPPWARARRSTAIAPNLPLLILAVATRTSAAQITGADTASKALFQGLFDASGAKGPEHQTRDSGLGTGRPVCRMVATR